MPSTGKLLDDDEKCAMVELREMTEKSRSHKNILYQEESPFMTADQDTMDMNLYSTKKIISQGLMDIALLTANASQLKHVLREDMDSPFHSVNVACLSISIILLVAVGVVLILSSRYNINIVTHQPKAEMMNSLTAVGAFLVLIANVFMSAFGSSL